MDLLWTSWTSRTKSWPRNWTSCWTIRRCEEGGRRPPREFNGRIELKRLLNESWSISSNCNPIVGYLLGTLETCFSLFCHLYAIWNFRQPILCWNSALKFTFLISNQCVQCVHSVISYLADIPPRERILIVLSTLTADQEHQNIERCYPVLWLFHKVSSSKPSRDPLKDPLIQFF